MDTCSPYCADPDTCDHKDGVCDCIDWVVGNTCNNVISKKGLSFIYQKYLQNKISSFLVTFSTV